MCHTSTYHVIFPTSPCSNTKYFESRFTDALVLLASLVLLALLALPALLAILELNY